MLKRTTPNPKLQTSSEALGRQGDLFRIRHTSSLPDLHHDQVRSVFQLWHLIRDTLVSIFVSKFNKLAHHCRSRSDYVNWMDSRVIIEHYWSYQLQFSDFRSSSAEHSILPNKGMVNRFQADTNLVGAFAENPTIDHQF